MSDAYNLYTEEIKKVALSFEDDKRLISYDGITTYPYGISAGLLCKQELLSKESLIYCLINLFKIPTNLLIIIFHLFICLLE